MRNNEHQIAVALMQWWGYYSISKKIDQNLLFAIPNGGHRHIAVARKMKMEGVRAGIPDYFLAVPRNGTPGLFLELKDNKGKVSKAQSEMIDKLGEMGYRCVVAFGIDEAIKAIESYLGVVEGNQQ